MKINKWSTLFRHDQTETRLSTVALAKEENPKGETVRLRDGVMVNPKPTQNLPVRRSFSEGGKPET